MAVAVALVALVSAFRSEPGGQSVLEPPANRGGSDGVALPLPTQEPPLPELFGSAAPSAPNGSGRSAGGGALAPPVRPGPTKAASSPKAAPAPPRYAAVSGESCGQSDASGYWNRGWFRDWYAVSAGGWTRDGCAGRMIAVPMSGDTNKDDPDNVIVWWFKVPGQATCGVSVFVPGTGNVKDAAGAPTTYLVYGTTTGSGSMIGQFGIDQVHNQGRWVDAGRYLAANGQLSVRMVTRGIDWGPGRDGAHHGVSAMRVTC